LTRDVYFPKHLINFFILLFFFLIFLQPHTFSFRIFNWKLYDYLCNCNIFLYVVTVIYNYLSIITNF